MQKVRAQKAIAIPETGLLLLPTKPTILEETVAKKNPNIAINNAPSIETGMSGKIAIATIFARTAIPTIFIFISASVLNPEFDVLPLIPFMASRNVVIISGNDLIKLIIPPAATAPAPI